MLICLSGCHPTCIPVAAQTKPIQQTILSPQALLPGFPEDSLYQGLREPGRVVALYRLRNYLPVWSDGHQRSAFGDSMLLAISNTRYHGLVPSTYHVSEVNSAWNSQDFLRADVLMTDAFFSIATDLRYGSQSARSVVFADSVLFSLLQAALSTSNPQSALQTCEPGIPAYGSLRKVLVHHLDSLRFTGDSASVEKTIRTIEINLDRWRSEGDGFGSRYILVNIPSYTLYAVDNNVPVLESRVIVGTTETPTPVFSSRLTQFITYPYWHVPRKIAVKEYLPAIQQDTSTIRKYHFDVLDRQGTMLNPDSIPWDTYTADNFPVTLRQREGPENALGVIKFIFANPYAVFLHDTNAKYLFREDVRALSHGCIRMEQAEGLAHYLITGTRGKQSKWVARFLKEREKHTVTLSKPIPIHVRYFTAEVRDGRLQVYPDIYGLDKMPVTGK